MRVLFVSPYVPSRIRVRPYHWIRALSRLGHEVHLVALRPPEDASTSDTELRTICTAVDIFPLSRSRTLVNGVVALPSRTPLQLAYSRRAAAERHVARLARSGRFDVVHIEHLRGVSLASKVQGVPCVYDAVDSISALFAQAAKLAPSRAQRVAAWLDLRRTRRFEAGAPFRFARTLVTSCAEADTFAELAGDRARSRIAVLPNGVDPEYFHPTAGQTNQRAVVFTGKLSYHANTAAALRLVTRIMPAVWREHPDAVVILAGKDPPSILRRLAQDPRVQVTGYVEDLRPVFARAAVAACPLVYGAGIQNKVLEAMASGVPVLATPPAFRALQASPDRDGIVRDETEFPTAIVRLLQDARLRAEFARAGRAYVRRHHDWRRLAESLVSVYQASLDPLN